MTTKRFQSVVDVYSKHCNDARERLKANVTARNELDARRAILERAWSSGLWVREIISIERSVS